MFPTRQSIALEAALIVTRTGVPVAVRRSGRARRMTLRVDPVTAEAVITVPPTAPSAQVRDFLDRHTGWIAERQAAHPGQTPFAPGNSVPIEGVPHRIEHRPGRGRPVLPGDGVLMVTGPDPACVPRRVREHLHHRARDRLGALSRAKAAHLPSHARALVAVTLKDTRSRWGSCSTTGRLSFSWRLIMAPAPVIDYVVAHEVAHLAEMNHGPRFWRLCAALTDGDVDASKTWLKREGMSLHRYG